MSHKGEKRRNSTMEFKRAVIEYAEKNSNHKAAEKFHVAVKRIRRRRRRTYFLANNNNLQLVYCIII